MTTDSLLYFQRREQQERTAVKNAACEAARKCHHEMATLYGFRVMMLSNASGLARSTSQTSPGEVLA